MKRFIPVVAASLLTVSLALSSTRLAHADSTAQSIIDARTHYAQIERNLKNYKRIQTDFSGQSAEGGTFVVYFHQGVPRKIVAHFYGETGNLRDDYYFWNGRLFFVLETRVRYDKPLGKEKRRVHERLYFADEKLIRWIDEKGKARRRDDKWFLRSESETLQNVRDYLAKANKLLD